MGAYDNGKVARTDPAGPFLRPQARNRPEGQPLPRPLAVSGGLGSQLGPGAGIKSPPNYDAALCDIRCLDRRPQTLREPQMGANEFSRHQTQPDPVGMSTQLNGTGSDSVGR
jgi:hypothetical protein